MATPTRRRRPASRTRRPAARTTHRPYRRPARRRRQQTSLGGAALAAAVIIGFFYAYPALALTLLVLAAAGGTAWLLHRTGRLHLPARPAATGTTGFAYSVAAYQAMSPTGFEHAIADLARRDPNVHTATVQGGANDRGLDVLVQLHDGRRIAIQCKRYATSNRVGAPVIYTANGTFRDYHRADQAVIVTTSGFTRDAERANAELARPLTLIDARRLTRWASGGRPPWHHG
ncbi:restriction endonuclease [Streptomyces sp. NPDC059740]|uniref:restriction endonuclease n=1 Tax=Streptomyces sp. NPDC059740 TaxID=3346926 RepID=UPI0036464A66